MSWSKDMGVGQEEVMDADKVVWLQELVKEETSRTETRETNKPELVKCKNKVHK